MQWLCYWHIRLSITGITRSTVLFKRHFNPVSLNTYHLTLYCKNLSSTRSGKNLSSTWSSKDLSLPQLVRNLPLTLSGTDLSLTLYAVKLYVLLPWTFLFNVRPRGEQSPSAPPPPPNLRVRRPTFRPIHFLSILT